MTGPPILRTPRLTLRPITEADTGAVVALFADPELSRFRAVDLTDPDLARAWVGRRLAYTGPPGTGEWVFDLAGAVVGVGRLKPSPAFSGRMLEFGVYLDHRYWGSGLVAEVTTAILGYAFGALAAPVVLALVDERNQRTRRAADRQGFLDVGVAEYRGVRERVLIALPEVAGRLHHVELWVPDLAATEASWGWLLTELGWTEYQRWPRGVSWRLGPTYLVFEDSPDRRGDRHDRVAPGLNHLALHAGSPERVESIAAAATRHDWRLMYADRHPHAGGPDHYAAYLENGDGYEVELVAHPDLG